MKLTKKQIDLIIENTPSDLHGQPVRGLNNGELGYYSPANANWAYHAVFIDYNGGSVLVATRFGHIV
jgi:hypothetical protein